MKKIKGDASIITTKSVKTPDGTEETVKEESVGVSDFNTEPAKVNFSVGMTLNLGNYESARIDVGVVMPCNPSELDHTFEQAKEWATTRLVKEAKTIKEFVAAR